MTLVAAVQHWSALDDAAREIAVAAAHAERAPREAVDEAELVGLAEGFVRHLSQAGRLDAPRLVDSYARWMRARLVALGADSCGVRGFLDAIREATAAKVGERLAAPLFERAAARVDDRHDDDLDDAAEPLGPVARAYLEALLAGDRASAQAIVFEALDEDGFTVPDVYLTVFQAVQRELGRRWQENVLTVAQEHFCTAATQAIMGALGPRLWSTPRRGYTFVGACVGGDLHEIGLRIVTDLLEYAGWDTHFLGSNISAPIVADAVGVRQADVLGISVTMPYHLGQTERLIRDVRASAAADVRILVGGYPFTLDETLYARIGADAWAADGLAAIDIARALVEARPAP